MLLSCHAALFWDESLTTGELLEWSWSAALTDDMWSGVDEQVCDGHIILAESSTEDFQGILRSCAAIKIA